MITKLNIADLNVRIDTEGESAAAFCHGFRYDFRCEPDVLVSAGTGAIKALKNEMPSLKQETVEKELLLKAFGDKLAPHGGVLFGGSLTAEEGGKYSLSLDRDEGKYYAVRRNKEGKYIIYSTPWTGEEPFCGELGSICIASRTATTQDGSISENDWFKTAVYESVTPETDEHFGELIGLLGDLYRKIQIKQIADNGI